MESVHVYTYPGRAQQQPPYPLSSLICYGGFAESGGVGVRSHLSKARDAAPPLSTSTPSIPLAPRVGRGGESPK